MRTPDPRTDRVSSKSCVREFIYLFTLGHLEPSVRSSGVIPTRKGAYSGKTIDLRVLTKVLFNFIVMSYTNVAFTPTGPVLKGHRYWYQTLSTIKSTKTVEG